MNTFTLLQQSAYLHYEVISAVQLCAMKLNVVKRKQTYAAQCPHQLSLLGLCNSEQNVRCSHAGFPLLLEGLGDTGVRWI